MKIAIGSDHGGFALKQDIIKRLEERGIGFTDKGCYDEKSCDYPIFAREVTSAVTSSPILSTSEGFST